MTAERIVITGAAGRLGSEVAARFHATGYGLVATDVEHPGSVPYPFVTADLRDHEQASTLLTDADVVLHIGNHPGLGARPPQQVFNENVAINENVFQGAVECGVRSVVFASTLQLIGSHPDARTVTTPPAPPTFPLSGDTAPAPSNVYALSKTVSETMLRYYAERCDLDAVALRFPMLHHHDDWAVVDTGAERPVDVYEGFTGLTYDDAAELFLAVVRSELRGFHVYMVGSAHRHRDLGVPGLISTFYPDADRGLDDLVDMSAVTAATGWRPNTTYRAPGD